MGLIDRLFRRASYPLSAVLPKFLGLAPSDAGVSVTPETAMAASAVYACVNVISSALAAMPVDVIRLRDSAKRTEHPVYDLLQNQPNDFQTPAVFREQMQAQCLLWGNAYAYIAKDLAGVPVGLYPLFSSQTRPQRIGGGPLKYVTAINGRYFEFRPDEVLHIPDIALDGVYGRSRIGFATNAIGLHLAMEKFGSKFFSNGGNLGGILEMPPGMKKESIKAFVESWKEQYSGPDNSLKTAMLTDGMKYTKTGTEPDKAQMVDTRTFQVREIARIFRVPLHKIGDLERATFSNIEHQAIEFMQDTIQPWAVKWEQEANRKLFTEKERGKLTLRFDLDSLLRADTLARYEAYSVGRQGGWLSVNDIRRKEGLTPVDGGEVLLQPLNMTPVSKPGGAVAQSA